MTPFQCVLGYHPPLFPWSGEPSSVPAVDDWIRRSERVWDSAHVCLQRAVRTQEFQANRRNRPHPPYQPGQQVWLSMRDLKLRLPSRKLSPKYVGPFKIIKQINEVTYQLELPTNYRISPSFHVYLLKPVHQMLTLMLRTKSHRHRWIYMDRMSCWTQGVKGVSSNIWWTVRAMDLRRDHGSCPRHPGSFTHRRLSSSKTRSSTTITMGTSS